MAITPSAARGVLDSEVRDADEPPGVITLSLLEGIDGNRDSAMLPAHHAARERRRAEGEDVPGG